MLILRVKQAEAALADGRLDEARQLLRDAEVRSHHRGQKLLGQLVRALLGRAEDHLAAGHADDALRDCQAAEDLGGNQAETSALRERIAEHLSAGRRRRHRRVDALVAAQEHIDNGRLSMGQQVLAELDSAAEGPQAEALRHKADDRRRQADAALQRAAEAMGRKDFAGAAEEIGTARALRGRNGGVSDLAAEVAAGAATEVAARLLDGRLDLAEALLEAVAPLAAAHEELGALARTFAQCRRAWRWIERGEPRRRRRTRRRGRRDAAVGTDGDAGSR